MPWAKLFDVLPFYRFLLRWVRARLAGARDEIEATLAEERRLSTAHREIRVRVPDARCRVGTGAYRSGGIINGNAA